MFFHFRQYMTSVGDKQRVYVLDAVRLLAIIGIICAHFFAFSFDSYGSIVGYWFANSVAPLVFVGIIGITSTLSHSSWFSIWVYCVAIFVIGLFLSLVSPGIVTVLPTLAVVIIVCTYVYRYGYAVYRSHVFFFASGVSIVALWIMSYALTWGVFQSGSASRDTISVLNVIDSASLSLYGFFLGGTYALSQWIPVAFSVQWLWLFVNHYGWIRDIIFRLYSFILLCGVIVAGVIHVVRQYNVFRDMDHGGRFIPPYITPVAFNNQKFDEYDVLFSPHTHAGSIAACAYGVAITFLSVVAGMYIRSLIMKVVGFFGQASLTAYVFSCMVHPFVSNGVVTTVVVVVFTLSVCAVSVGLWGRGLCEMGIRRLERELTIPTRDGKKAHL